MHWTGLPIQTYVSAMTNPNWHLRGQVLLACNCDFGCPCNFNGLPTHGKCEGNWNWHIEDGQYGDVSLSGLNMSLAVNWPAAIHEGNGDAMLLLDSKANDQQRDALRQLISGQVGGPWQIIATTIAKQSEPEFVAYEIEFDGISSTVKAGDNVTLKMAPVKNKVTGAEVHPRVLLPEGFVFQEGDLGASTEFKVSGAVNFDHSGRYAAIAPFEYKSA